MRLKYFIGVAVMVTISVSQVAVARTNEPTLRGKHWVAITGKPLAATAGARISHRDGTAADAACAMLAATSSMFDTPSWGAEFGMNVQQAVEAPNIWSFQMRNSFDDHQAEVGRLLINEATPGWVRKELTAMGYSLDVRDCTSGPINTIHFDRANGAFEGGVKKTLEVLNHTRAGEQLYKNETEATAPHAAIHALKRAGETRRSKLPPGWWGEPPPILLTADVSNTGGFDPERLWGNDVDWEPAIAVDRRSSDVYQMTSRYGVPQCKRGCADPAIIFRRSSDGGETWEPDQYVLTSEGAQNDPEIEVAGDGVLYAALMDDFVPGVVFIKSQDRGETWSDPIPMTSPSSRISWSDKPMLAVSQDGKDVYLAFNASHSFVAASHDHGETWAAAVKTNHDLRYWFHSGAAVSPNGDVYFASSDYAADFRGGVGLDIIRSTDGGMTWSTDRVDTSAQLPDCQWSPGCYFGFFGPQVAVAVDSAGTVMIAYNASNLDGAPQSLYVRVSGNGVDWGERVLISPPSGNVLAGFPALASGVEPGDFRVAWMDDRNGSKEAFNVWYRQTSDGGLSWSEAVRLSAAKEGAPYKTAGGFAFPYGDYLEIGVDGDGATHAIWGEGVSYVDKGGTWYARSR